MFSASLTLSLIRSKVLRTRDSSLALKTDLPETAVDVAVPMKPNAKTRALRNAFFASLVNWSLSSSLTALEKMRTVS